jgi:superfamily II DNA/RNA helicase
VHRVGRTARAQRKGQAITFVNEKEMREFGRIEALIGYEVKKMPLPEQFGRGPAYDPKARAPGGGGKGNGHRRSGGGRRKPGGGGRR